MVCNRSRCVKDLMNRKPSFPACLGEKVTRSQRSAILTIDTALSYREKACPISC